MLLSFVEFLESRVYDFIYTSEAPGGSLLPSSNRWTTDVNLSRRCRSFRGSRPAYLSRSYTSPANFVSPGGLPGHDWRSFVEALRIKRCHPSPLNINCEIERSNRKTPANAAMTKMTRTVQLSGILIAM
jgi:hypothetical protein